MSRMRRKSAKFMKPRLEQLMNVHPVIGDVRGLGLDAGSRDREGPRHARNESASCGTRSSSSASSAGLLVLGAGPSTIRLSPPLLIDEEQADCAVRILSRERFPPRRREPCRFLDAGARRAHSFRPPFRDRWRRLPSLAWVIALSRRAIARARGNRSGRLGRRRPGFRRSEGPALGGASRRCRRSRKQQRVIRAARSYIAHYRLQDAAYRFDILAVTVRPARSPNSAFCAMLSAIERY